MSLKVRGKWIQHRFHVAGKSFSDSTGLLATPNRKDPVWAEAAVFEARARAEALRNPVPKEDHQLVRPGLFAAVDSFMKWCRNEYTKPKTLEKIQSSMNVLMAFLGDKLVDTIGNIDLERFKAFRFDRESGRGVKETTVRNDLNAASLLFKHCIRMDWRTPGSNFIGGDRKDPQRVKVPGDSGSFVINDITASEAQRWFEAVSNIRDARGQRNMYDLTKVMYAQGCRPEEVFTLPKNAVNFETGWMHIAKKDVMGKTHAAKRALFMTAETAAILKQRLSLPGPYFFPGRKSVDVPVDSVQNAHRLISLKEGFSFRIYDFRHAFATRMLTESKVDVVTLARIMGHSNLKMIMRYVHTSPNAIQQAMMADEAVQLRSQIRRVS